MLLKSKSGSVRRNARFPDTVDLSGAFEFSLPKSREIAKASHNYTGSRNLAFRRTDPKYILQIVVRHILLIIIVLYTVRRVIYHRLMSPKQQNKICLKHLTQMIQPKSPSIVE